MRWCSIVCGLLLLVGCGGKGFPSATVTGKVTINGQPATSGHVQFAPAAAGQGPVVAGAIEAGQYRCLNTPLGKHTVTFLITRPITIHDAVTGEDHSSAESLHWTPEFASGVPCEVGAGTNERDFNLKTVD